MRSSSPPWAWLDLIRYLQRGEKAPLPFSIAGIRCALTVCYDLRFPEVYRPLAAAGVELLVIPAQWPSPRIHHWRALLVARAIENQAYVLGMNRRGVFGDVEFGGNSLLVGPTGEIIVDAEMETGIFTGAIDLATVAEIRSSFPCLHDRRGDLYPLSGDDG